MIRFEQLGIDLLFEIRSIEHVDLAGQRRRRPRLRLVIVLSSANRSRFASACVVAVLGLDLGGKVLVLAGDIGVPPGQVERDLQRPHLGLVSGHERRGRCVRTARLVIGQRGMSGRKNHRQTPEYGLGNACKTDVHGIVR